MLKNCICYLKSNPTHVQTKNIHLWYNKGNFGILKVGVNNQIGLESQNTFAMDIDYNQQHEKCPQEMPNEDFYQVCAYKK